MLFAQIGGGAVLFLVGMKWLSAALREAAGERLRRLLTAAAGSRWRGLALGTSVGFLVHSSSAVVMTVGFVHAGLLTLGAALPVLFGANIGTTLSMQLISLRLTDYALAAVAVGGALYLIFTEGRGRTWGQAILGFGLLFLGMKVSGDAIEPHRAAIEPWLARIDGTSPAGMLLGIGIATLVTIAVQSSGAVIGMTFVLAGSGALTSLGQTYPIVLGAHIGTTVTGLVASLGASVDARRAAIANLLFNIFNAGAGALAAPVLIPLLEKTATGVAHQTANTHTAIMVGASVLMLPLTRPAAALLRKFWKTREAEPETTHLDPALLRTPEDALVATIQELGRSARLCGESFRLVNEFFRCGDRKLLRRVARNELASDEIKTSVRSYLVRLARDYLSRRQALFAQGLNRCVVELERVADHIESLGALGRGGSGRRLERLDQSISGSILKLAEMAEKAVRQLAESFNPEANDFDAVSWTILETRKTYVRESAPVKAEVIDRLAKHEVAPDLALAFSEYAAALDRIVRHCAVIAQEQRQPCFAIKKSKLGRLRGPHAPQISDQEKAGATGVRNQADERDYEDD